MNQIIPVSQAQMAPDQQMIKLIPLAMTIPNELGVYQLSHYWEPVIVTEEEWRTYSPITIKVGTPENWREAPAYGKGLDCWYIAMEA